MNRNLILASSSPRRREILSGLGIPFEVIPPDVPETGLEGESHDSYVRRIAESKAEAVSRFRNEAWVLGADTVVVCGTTRLGKPSDIREARAMLQFLSGKRHEVITGFYLLCRAEGARLGGIAKTAVWFRTLGAPEIEDYIGSPEPYDKAGSYGIQGAGGGFIERIEGELFNVIGLPVAPLKEVLKQAGFQIRARDSGSDNRLASGMKDSFCQKEKGPL